MGHPSEFFPFISPGLVNSPERWDELLRGLVPAYRAPGREGRRRVHPRVEIIGTPETYELHLEIPGVDPETVEVTITGETLTVRGDKKLTEPRDGEHVLVTERSTGPFERTFTFPSAIDADRADASTKDGVMTIRVPKAAGAQPVKVFVKGGDR